MKFLFCAFIAISNLLFMNVAIAQPGKPVADPQTIVKSYAALMDYYSAHLSLSEDFAAYDVNGHAISKGDLLKAVTTGNCLPLQLYEKIISFLTSSTS